MALTKEDAMELLALPILAIVGFVAWALIKRAFKLAFLMALGFVVVMAVLAAL